MFAVIYAPASDICDLVGAISSRNERDGEWLYFEIDAVKRTAPLWRTGANMGVAPSIFVARVAAQQGGVRVVYPGEEADFLAKQPVLIFQPIAKRCAVCVCSACARWTSSSPSV